MPTPWPDHQSQITITFIHLYLHIPFCHRICPYCSFYKHTPGNTDMARFVDALLAEAGDRSSRLPIPGLETVYLGGGTPSMLSPFLLRRLLEGLREIFRFLPGAEINLEANPATFGRQTASAYADLGISRVSLGAQSFDPGNLTALGRTHGPSEITRSFALLREAGIENVSIDLIFSIPGQSLSQWRHSLEKALSLSPTHISAYNLTYEEDTPFFERFQQGLYHDKDELNAEMFELAHKLLTQHGFRHYETSNYAQPGFESCHNRAYWAGMDYLGLGPSAVSTIAGRRWKNIPDTRQYIQLVEQAGHAEHEAEDLTGAQLDLERIALMLRTDQGVHRRHLGAVSEERIGHTIEEGLAGWDGDHLRLLGRGPLLVDSIVSHLAD